VVLVVALQRVSESPDAQQILNTIFDPVYEKDFGLNIISTIAQRAIRLMDKCNYTEKQFAMVSVRNHLNAFKNPYAHLKLRIAVEDVLKSRVLCWPIKLLDCCPRSDGACAVILTSDKKAAEVSNSPAWIKGLASLVEGYFIGDRDLAFPEYYSLVARKAYDMAGIDNPLAQIDVAELYGAFTVSEMVQYEALGFCDKGEAGKFVEDGTTEMTGDLPINPSGGVQSANPIGATALVRIAEAALQVMGKAGERQVPGVEIALATGSGGAAQFFSVMILGKERGRG
jgi:acetyl-CoA C-acetyltransferase